MKNFKNYRLFIGLLVFVYIVSVACGSEIPATLEATSQPTPTATINPLANLPTPDANLTYEEIHKKYESGNSSSREALQKEIKGVRIRWFGKVTGGDKDSYYVHIGENSWTLHLKCPGYSDAMDNKYIIFEATIDEIFDFFGASLFLEDGVILETLDQAPTLTPTMIPPTSSPTPSSTPTVTETQPPTPTSTPEPVAQFTLSKNANIRSGPGTEYLVVSGGKAGDLLAVYGKNPDGKWLLIDPVKYWWVAVSLGTLDKQIDSMPLAPTAEPTLTPTMTLTPTLRPTRTPVPTATLIPTRTPVPAVSLDTIYNNYQSMTALQFKEYTAKIVGKPIRETVVVGNVDENGRVIVSGDWSPWLFNVSEFCVIVSGVPHDVGISITGGEKVDLEATINRIVGDYNYFYNCENTLVLYYVSIK